MKRISIDDLTGFADICECERLLGEIKGAGCGDPTAPQDNAGLDALLDQDGDGKPDPIPVPPILQGSPSGGKTV